MTFKNNKHAERFFNALSNVNIDSIDRELMATVFLLTSYKRIWKQFEKHFDEKNGICPAAFDCFEPHNETEEAIVTAAYDLLFCSDCINLTDLTDKETIPDKAFLAICHAIGYIRYGFDSEPNENPVKEIS